MFEVPSAKRVKRSQLFNSDDEDAGSIPKTSQQTDKNQSTAAEDDTDLAMPDYGFEYEFISQPSTTNPDAKPTTTSNKDPVVDDTETYQFNLFAPSSKPIATTTTGNKTETSPSTSDDVQPGKGPDQQPHLISIRSPSPLLETIQSLQFNDPRPQSHYFTSALPSDKLEKLRTSYAAAAISPSTLSTLSKSPWPGTYQSWRVISLPCHKRQVIVHKPSKTTKAVITSTKSGDGGGEVTRDTVDGAKHTLKTRRRPRPSKKRRDLIRSKAKKRQVIIDETKSKEEHEREKKNKKNRERKLKRRAKERREKEEGKMKGSEEMGDGSEVGKDEEST